MFVAMGHSGVGQSHIRTFLANLGVPPLSSRALKKRENEVRQAFQKVADKSCETARQEEARNER